MISAFVPGAYLWGSSFRPILRAPVCPSAGPMQRLAFQVNIAALQFQQLHSIITPVPFSGTTSCRVDLRPAAGEAEGSGPKAGSASEHPSKPRTCLSPRSQTGRSWPEAGFHFSLRTDPAETHGSKEANGQAPQASVRNRRFTVTPK